MKSKRQKRLERRQQRKEKKVQRTQVPERSRFVTCVCPLLSIVAAACVVFGATTPLALVGGVVSLTGALLQLAMA